MTTTTSAGTTTAATSTTRRAAIAAILAAAASPAVLAQPVQPISPNAGPFRTTADEASERVMLSGHDPVAYFTRRAAVRGDPAISLEHEGVTWRFASAEHRERFRRDPLAYMPQFGGYCSNGINYAIPGGGGGGPDTWRIYRGRLYVFGGRSARDHFEMDTELNLERAHRYWNEEIAGANPTLTRLRRMVFRVPHYRSDASLQQEWEERLAARTLPVMPGAQQVVPER